MSYYEQLKNLIITNYANLKQDNEYYYLYKHFSFGQKDSKNEFDVLNTFNESCLLYSDPSVFNDPYDCICKINYSFDGIKRKEVQNILNKKIRIGDFISDKSKYITEIKNNDIVQNWGKYNRENFKLTCFNNSPLDILMWSHYAAYHSGFVIEFKFKKIENCFNHLPIPVFYNDTFPVIDNYPYNLTPQDCITNKELGAEIALKFFSNKAKCWEYEREFRQIPTDEIIKEFSSKKVIAKFDSDLFSSVIFGAMIDNRTRDETIKAVNYFNNQFNQNIQCYQARMVDYEYRLEVPDHPRL